MNQPIKETVLLYNFFIQVIEPGVIKYELHEHVEAKNETAARKILKKQYPLAKFVIKHYQPIKSIKQHTLNLDL